MIDSQYPGLSRALTDSLLWRSVLLCADTVVAAWRSSRTADLFRAMSNLATLRSVAIIGAVAGVVALTAQLIIPAYVRSGLPFAWPLTFVALLIVLAMWPSEFERAWRQSRIARLFTPGG